MIKIIHIITCLDRGGAERMLSNVVTGMDTTKFNNIVVSLKTKGSWGTYLEEQGIKVYALNLGLNFKTPKNIISLIKLIKKEQPVLIQTWLYHANLLGILLKKIFKKIPLIWNIRCAYMNMNEYSISSKFIFYLTIKFARTPDVVLTNSYAAIEYHEETGYHTKKWHYIPNGFDIKKFKPSKKKRFLMRTKLKLKNNVPLIGMIARFDHMKDHKTFLNAAQMMAELDPKIKFLLAGNNINNKNSYLMELIKDRNLEKNIFLFDEIDNIEDILPALDLCTLSSIAESFPNVIGEAMACGITCITTDAGDAKKIIQDSGVVVPIKDPFELASKWFKNIYMYKDDRKDLQLKAREIICSEFSLESVIKKYEEFYTTFEDA